MIKGITKDKIIDETKKLIAENGLSDFSMHILADRLHVKTASLYTHVSGIQEVLSLASQSILHDYHEEEMKAIEGKHKKDALVSLALKEKQYAEENPAYYELIMNLQLSDDPELKKADALIVQPIMQILDEYKLNENQKTDAERAFRAGVYGFISQEKHGYFTHFSQDPDKSFLFMIDALTNGIGAMENE